MIRSHPWLAALALMAVACGSTTTGAAAPGTAVVPVVPTPSTSPITSPITTGTTVPTSTTPTSSTSTSSTTTSSTTTTTVASVPTSFDALSAATTGLLAGNAAASVSVWRHGEQLFGWAGGSRVDGGRADSDTPFVIASVSKLVTAITLARLVQRGDIATNDLVPWDTMGVAHDPGWNNVTVRELLAHTSGMPINRMSWLNDPGSCRIPLEAAMAAPPLPERGTWVYSNGNYCALGLLVESLSGVGLDEAANTFVFQPASITGPYLTTEGLQPNSAPYAKGVARLERLGGAGTWIASSDDIGAMLSVITPSDLEILQWPGITLDQYGWGHTGTVDGAKACAWVMDDLDIVLVAMVSGQRPGTGGALCDVLLPALATDLGVWADKPVRNPP